MSERKRAGAWAGTIQPRDPFDLIRHLARTQTDPRKAVCELVQNSLDAGARRILVARERSGQKTVLRVLDDGAGVRPELDRLEALRSVAESVGCSRKHGLSLEERGNQLGQYGIGLLGFWAVGERLRIRSRVEGGRAWSLELIEDCPRYALSEEEQAAPDVPDSPPRDEPEWFRSRATHTEPTGSASNKPG